VVEDSKFKKETMEVVTTEVSLSFSALSDAHIFNFIKAMQLHFPGYVQLTSLSLVRNQNIDPSIIQDILDGNAPEMVSGSLDFRWWDYKEIIPNDQDGGAS